MEHLDGGVLIRAELSDRQKAEVGLRDIKDMVLSRFDRPYECSKENWRINADGDGYAVTIDCDMKFPLQYGCPGGSEVEKGYDIMEDLECRFAGPKEIKLLFLGI